MPKKFANGQHVTVVDERSSFVFWGGKIISQLCADSEFYIVAACYPGWNDAEPTLRLTFKSDQLRGDNKW